MYALFQQLVPLSVMRRQNGFTAEPAHVNLQHRRTPNMYRTNLQVFALSTVP